MDQKNQKKQALRKLQIKYALIEPFCEKCISNKLSDYGGTD